MYFVAKLSLYLSTAPSINFNYFTEYSGGGGGDRGGGEGGIGMTL